MYQLKIYEIDLVKQAAFHTGLRSEALRIMSHYGFHLSGMWETICGDKVECVYLFKWPDRHTMTRCWQSFLSDDEWVTIKNAVENRIGAPVMREMNARLNISPEHNEVSPSGHTTGMNARL